MYPTERKFKARMERAKAINKATILLLIITGGLLTGYLTSTIAKVTQ